MNLSRKHEDTLRAIAARDLAHEKQDAALAALDTIEKQGRQIEALAEQVKRLVAILAEKPLTDDELGAIVEAQRVKHGG